MSQQQYHGLSRAQLSYEYLHTNSTTHEFLFGALAELLDNSRDAGASKIQINTVTDESFRGGYMLEFIDDGEGMDQSEAADIITFGKSSKRAADRNMIGQYGNGLKSGSMRLGKDFILFTKKGEIVTCVFLSRTFHEEERIEEVIVPLPSFYAKNKSPVFRHQDDKERFKTEMDLILKYSPFKTRESFFAQFDKISSASGTLILIFNLKIMDNGNPELDIITNEYDIMMGNHYSEEESYPEKRSFRAYSALLYCDPKMRIYIRGKKVQTKRLADCLYRPRMYRYTSLRFKRRSEQEALKAVQQARIAEEKAREAESKAKDYEMKFGSQSNKEARAKARQARIDATELRKEAKIKNDVSDSKQKALKEPKTLSFIFGLNLNNRCQQGVFIYNCSRLVKMYQTVGPQIEGGVNCSGVLGYVDVPYLVLEPTHNKQDFADAKEFRHLLKALGDFMAQYWKDSGISTTAVSFWEKHGYISTNWSDPPSDEPKYLRKRAFEVFPSIQCDSCLKWRKPPFSNSNIGRQFPDNWTCKMNPDTNHNKCNLNEQKLTIPLGTLKKENKTAEGQQLAEEKILQDIKKNQERLDKLRKNKIVLSKEDYPDSDPPTERLKEKVVPVGRAEPVKRAGPGSSRPVGRASLVKVTSSVPAKPKPLAKKLVPRRASPPPAKQRKRIRSLPDSSAEEEEEEEEEEEAEEDEEEEEEEEEDEVVEEPVPSPPRKRPAPKSVREAAASRARPARPAVSVVTTTTAPPPSRRKAASVTTAAAAPAEVSEEPLPSQQEEEEPSFLEDSTSDDTAPAISSTSKYVGRAVEAKMGRSWMKGRVISAWPGASKKAPHRVRVKFDQNPQNKHDKQFAVDSPDLRILNGEKTPSSADESSEVKSEPAEAPSTTMLESASMPETPPANQLADNLANGYRTCLRYFLPPEFSMGKESIGQLTPAELLSFPLDDFFDQYEKGLKKLVNGFQAQTAASLKEAELHQAKLKALRHQVATLLNAINQDVNIDPEASEDVDKMLALCVKQATESDSQ